MFVEIQPHVSYRDVSYKKTCDLTQLPSHLDNTAVASFLLPCAESFSLIMTSCIHGSRKHSKGGGSSNQGHPHMQKE